MEWLDQHFHEHDNLPRPDWERIYAHVDKYLSDSDQHQLWSEIARRWVSTLAGRLPAGYTSSESDNFLLLSKGGDRYIEVFQAFLERCRKRLLSILKGIANDEGYGRFVVMVFDDTNTYYDYTSYFGPQEGTYGLSSGMYLNYGYGHFVFPYQELDFAEPIAAHEMTHALLTHLPIPLWLEEGIAVNMEAMVCGSTPPRLDREMYAKHQAFWGEQEIQEFWTGDSFHRPDDGQQLSYQLAQTLVTNLSENYEAFVEFANKAARQDGGESAAEEVYGISLGDLIFSFLGEGEWWPQPGSWEHQNSGSRTLTTD